MWKYPETGSKGSAEHLSGGSAVFGDVCQIKISGNDWLQRIFGQVLKPILIFNNG